MRDAGSIGFAPAPRLDGALRVPMRSRSSVAATMAIAGHGSRTTNAAVGVLRREPRRLDARAHGRDVRRRRQHDRPVAQPDACAGGRPDARGPARC